MSTARCINTRKIVPAEIWLAIPLGVVFTAVRDSRIGKAGDFITLSQTSGTCGGRLDFWAFVGCPLFLPLINHMVTSSCVVVVHPHLTTYPLHS